MRILGISIDVGAGATPMQLEGLVKAVRVAVDVGRAAELSRLQRSASERLKFPTDRELRGAVERLPHGSESSAQYRAQELLDVRHSMEDEARSMPPEMWWRYWRRDRREPDLSSGLRSGAGYERAFDASPLPWLGGATIGLNAMDPDLYAALVSEEVARLAPDDFTVRSLRYENPFGEEVVALDQGAAALTRVAGVIETAATLGSRRTIMKADAAFAEATVNDRIASSGIGVELEREQLRASRLANALAEEELLAKRIQNAQALDSLSATRRQQALVEQFTRAGQLDEATAIAAIDPSDAAALVEFAMRPPELAISHEPDPDDET